MIQRPSQLWFKRLLRSAAFSVASLLVLAVGFWIYWHFQPATSAPSARRASTGPSAGLSGNTTAGIGPGNAPWVDDYDGGKLTSMFHARTFNPRPDGQFDVDHPVWVFYLSDGQYLLLTGDSGLVHVDSDTSNGSAGNAGASMMSPSSLQAPTSGTLQHVVVTLFPDKLASTPTLTFVTNNIAFDHDTLRLYTQSFTDDTGQTIAADRVPVTVRGDEYDFDGWGLTMHWNDRDRRLQLLQIDHGKSLVIKHPGHLAAPGSGTATTSANAEDAPLPERLAEAPPGAVGVAVAAKHADAQPPPTIYHALFEDHVRVFQSARQMAAADDMGVDFLQGKPRTATTTPAATTSPLALEPPPTAEPTAPLAAQRAVNASAAPPTSRPTTAPAAEPITVTWTGPLRITPLDGAGALPLSPGQAVVRMVGSPVVLTPEGSTVTAAAVVYRSGDSAGRLENSPTVPRVQLRQQHGTSFEADSMSYDPATAIATILGHSDLQMPVESTGGPARVATVTWQERGLIHVIARNGQPSAVDHVDLFGSVVVDHPQFNLDSEQLALDLEPASPTPRPTTALASSPNLELRRVTATGRANCRLLQPGQADRSIRADRLVLTTAPGPDGKLVPREMVADGSVQASDPSQDQILDAGHLDVVLSSKPAVSAATTKPGDMPAVAVQSLDAADAVHATLKGGSTADAAELHLSETNGHQLIVLRGTPNQPARVSDGKKNDLSGPTIRIAPDSSLVGVIGPGTAHTDRRSSATQPSQPVEVAWSHDLLVNGQQNTVDVHGNVVATALDAQADHDRITGDAAHADLMDAPRPVSTRPTTAPSGLGNKQIRDFRLVGSVVGNTLLTDSTTGGVLRRGELHGGELTYDAVRSLGMVPGAGWLTVEDHRPSEATTPTADAGGGTRGSMAIAWDKSLTFDDAANVVTFDGNIHTGFRQTTSAADPMQMDCDQMMVNLAPPKPAGPNSSPGPGAQQKMDVKNIIAQGNVQFRAKDLRFTAETVTFDPATGLLTADGTDQVPGQTFNGASENTGTFQELVYDTRAEIIKSSQGVHGEFHR